MMEYTRECKDYYGGIKSLWLATFVDYDESEIVVYDGVLDTFPSTTVYKYDVEGDYSQDYREEWSQTLGFRVMNYETGEFQNNKFRAIVETYNGNYIMLGLFGGLDAVISNTSGTGLADFSGLDITMSGNEEEAAVEVDINDFIIG